MIELAGVVTVAGLVVWLHMTAYYVLATLKRDASIVDIVWGLGFVLLAAVLIPQAQELTIVHSLVWAMIAAWGLRLGLHIFSRKAGAAEDWRYQNWRQQWGKTYWWRSYLQIFMLQGVLQLIIAAPILIVAASSGVDQLSVIQIVGALIWLVGFYFEAVGDWQLSKFIARKKAQPAKHSNKKKQPTIMKSGLWRYTRHPNYFGEITQWWGLFLIVLPLESGLFAIISPLAITFLLLKVSGITMLERRYDDNKEYQKYKQCTSALLPLPPKNN